MYTPSTHIEDGHHFQCECGSRFTTARFAAKCCKKSCTDLRDGAVTEYNDAAEAEAEAAYIKYLTESAKLAKYECSCGERFRAIEHAVRCRKCRTYTEKGYCTEVYDRDLGEVVWTR